MTFQNKTYRFAPNSLSSYLQRILLLMILPSPRPSCGNNYSNPATF